ncbi:MAG: 16S rRNA (cytosine(967)-C(5))-methyltransferase RsmB [Candidatus Marinimicrobia bacterium]|jgi:16S rRNA (cytosine967-C5)-methyltransferase|nr:16S rRNA (cytosine(967)-C(5))-methyltransferase RsmB [Candidatus Neomarinimicrobiota bacterium]MBT3500918.1 16S rRNA (cytosine(967)-C(5))-methyltransferase RsmB [Candidatus Neomarinimicrobiota bacterium]MBT3840087.1 16S rRNA (cytosine(967)-C(5))-methyltransferase RsmB [Candidatus Neomarinimicrobiota bacterium]MBT3999944.1 16S rRNA (cytosine(967)-C(5))-methyltransferase RsmB [Candidatus Neomarinimicrobiota bacterium]MBT4282994.1 16S rRNA (cytosine(967)-C(5))-methyltransferase RsmB [Candidatus
MKQDARFLSVKVLTRFEKKNEQLSLARNQVFSSFKPDSPTKSRTTVITNEIIRLKSRLDLMIEHISSRKMERLNISLQSILRIGFYEIIYNESIPDYASVDSAVNLTKDLLNRKASGLTNAVLRNLIRKKESNHNWDKNLKENFRWHSIPKWLQKRWKNQFGEKGFLELANRLNQSPSLFVRVDISQNNVENIIDELRETGIDVIQYSDIYLKIKSGSGKLFSTNLFNSGEISIQDPAAGAIVEFLNPQKGETILDICAAPGTKSLFMAERVGQTGKILASDFDQTRVNRGKSDLKRHGKNNIEWSLKDATKDEFPMSDKILIDAPCTGTGVIGRKPDIRWRRNPENIKELAALQFQILNHMSKFLNTGGTLVYATCSLEPEENWNVVEQFLKLNESFQLVAGTSTLSENWVNEQSCLQTFPHVHGVDGMFAAKLKRK